ncbi:MAG: hypothetical protein KGI97_03370 [Alphaproteobacteria bacterium]|nr:hypothetical protein [Alphaproteobacteria bacterium]
MSLRPLLAAALVFPLAFSLAAPARAEQMRPDDTVTMTLSAENWVTTKTARVTLNIEASVSAATAARMRADMQKAAAEVAKGDWRLTGFTRAQDQTGLDRWSASFTARLPEADLGGLTEAAKKVSRAGMQVSVGPVSFTPTLEETEAARAALRAKLYKDAESQLAALNASLPGRAYRIAHISFNAGNPPFQPRPMFRATMMANAAPQAPESGMERSEKLMMNAYITYAALPPGAKH